ncbi:phospholipase-like protein [Artemisia annua]|uniref:Phospholipase-like protein n=1 Tax=Artemisia annua TaxID=35608 RepID=A0A2U1PW25_ARTAN|nr:phospholipase-like protein [Artemisia annua]
MVWGREYEAKVIVRSKLNYLSLIRDKLNEKRRILFRTSCFGGWLDLLFFDHEPHLLDYIFQKQGHVDDEHYDMPLIYTVDGRELHFGRPEFSLITGFRFGKWVSQQDLTKGDIKFKTRVFPNKMGIKLSNLDLLGLVEDEELFSNLSDEDAVRVCLLLALEVIFMGRLLADHVDDKLLRLVEDLDAWNNFPWGEYVWRQLYNQILNVVDRHKWQHLKGLEGSPKFVPTYTVGGFVWAFKIWILESFETSNRWWNKLEDVIPRGVAWSKKGVFTRSDYRLLFCKVLAYERTCGYRAKLDFSESFSHLNYEFRENLQSEFFELVDSLISASRSSQNGGESYDDIVHEYLLEEELSMRKQQEEKWIMEEQKRMEMVFHDALIEETKRRMEREEQLKIARDKKNKRTPTFGCCRQPDMNNEHLHLGVVVNQICLRNLNMFNLGWRVKFSTEYDEFLGKLGPLRCTFPWSKEPHIELWVEYMLHFRPAEADWAMVTPYFVQLLLQDSIPVWYANGDKYKIHWADVEQVFMPINEKDKHWFVANLHIKTGVVTCYDSGQKHEPEWRHWYLNLRACLQVQMDIVRRLPVKRILQCRSVSKSWKSAIDTFYFTIKSGVRQANNFPYVLQYRQGFREKRLLAFGIRPDNLDPTILKIAYPFNPENPWCVLLFSFNSKRWKHLDEEFLPGQSIRLKKSSQAVVDGHILWCAYESLFANDGSEYKSYMMMSFNLVTQRFHVLGIPAQLLAQLPVPFYVSNLRDKVVVSGNLNVEDHFVFCVWTLEVVGGSIQSFQCLIRIPTPCPLKLIGFDNTNNPILEVQSPEGYVMNLVVYNISFGTFMYIADEGNCASFFINPNCESLILQTHEDKTTYYIVGITVPTVYHVVFCMSIFRRAGLPVVLDQAKVFKKKGIDPTTYAITFKNAKKVPAQGGIFGDCGIWACIFLYRLTHGKSLEVDNPVQAALAYRENMSSFFSNTGCIVGRVVKFLN